MQNLFYESTDYINTFLKREEMQATGLKTVADLVTKYSDISITSNEEEKTFRLLAIEKKNFDAKRPKTVQLFNFGLKRRNNYINDYSENSLPAYKEEFIIFTKYFHIQKKYSEIKILKEDIEKSKKK